MSLFVDAFIAGGVAVLIAVSVLWVLSRRLRDVSIVDVFGAWDSCSRSGRSGVASQNIRIGSETEACCMKIFLYAAFSLVLVAMLWVTVTASLDRSVLQAAGEIWEDPWGKATLFDAYFAFLTVFLWIAWREHSWGRNALWLILILSLGNFAIAGYFLFALSRIGPDGSWTELFERTR